MPFISAGMAGLLSYVPAQGDDAGGKLGPSAAGKNDLLKSIAFHCRAVKARWGRMPCPGRACRAGRRRGRISAGSNLNLTLDTAIRHPSSSRVGRAEERTSPPGGMAGIPAARSGAAPPGDGLFVPVWAFFGGRSGSAGEWRDREGNPGDGFRGAGPGDRAGPRPFFKNIPPERQNVLRLLYRNTAKTGWKRQKTA